MALRLCRRVSVLFKPHVHTSHCVVCGDATARALAEEKLSGQPSKKQRSLVAVSDKSPSPVGSSAGCSSSQAVGALTSRQEQFACAILQWMRLPESADFRAGRPDAPMEDGDKLLRSAEATASVHTPLVSVSDELTLDADGPQTALFSSLTLSTLPAANAFLRTVQEAVGVGNSAVEKQLRFQCALLDFQQTLQTTTGFTDFFLACGTALGAHREGYFIPHDDDVDIGMFYRDLVTFARGQRETVGLQSDSALASWTVERILSDLSGPNGGFLPFDVCGTVERGLEVRLLHLSTDTRVDVNVYYSETGTDELDSAGLSAAGESGFVWTATYYERAAERAYGMYRYRHKAFKQSMQRRLFCARTTAAAAREHELFNVPPTSYLEEYFGDDWRTPKIFSYAEGVSGEYKNIIDE